MAVSPSPEKPPNTKRKHDNRPETTPDNDEFGDIDDDELISAETGFTTAQAGDENVLDQHQSKKIKVESQPLEDDEQHFHEAAALARSILLKTWGFSAFRLKQEAAIARLIAGKSVVVVFPTGGGKSLVYQVPALAFDDWDGLNGQIRGGGLTLVVSPLIALMKVCYLYSAPRMRSLNFLTGPSRCSAEARRLCGCNGFVAIERGLAGQL